MPHRARLTSSLVLVALATAALSACGGSGGSSTKTTAGGGGGASTTSSTMDQPRAHPGVPGSDTGTPPPGPGGAPAVQADLVVVVDDGSGAKPQRFVVKCPAHGKVGASQCAALAADPHVFEALPGDQPCTQVYGGPDTATVKGTLNGEDVDAKLSRTDGCHIDQWDRAKAVWGPSLATAHPNPSGDTAPPVPVR